MKNNNHLLTGLVIGGVAAGIAALLTAPKSGEDLCGDIADTYNNIADKTGQFTDEIKHKSWHVLHPGATCEICEPDNTISNFAVGALAGAAIGAASAFLLAPKSGQGLRKDIQETYHDALDKGEDLKEGVENFIGHLQSTISSGNKNHSSKLGQIIDLASTGFTIWQKLQKRK
jgi:gas vesicle protein